MILEVVLWCYWRTGVCWNKTVTLSEYVVFWSEAEVKAKWNWKIQTWTPVGIYIFSLLKAWALLPLKKNDKRVIYSSESL